MARQEITAILLPTNLLLAPILAVARQRFGLALTEREAAVAILGGLSQKNIEIS